MKIFLNTILLANTIWVFLIADNPDLTVFIYPLCIYVVFGFLRANHRAFVKLLNTPVSHDYEVKK